MNFSVPVFAIDFKDYIDVRKGVLPADNENGLISQNHEITNLLTIASSNRAFYTHNLNEIKTQKEKDEQAEAKR